MIPTGVIFALMAIVVLILAVLPSTTRPIRKPLTSKDIHK